VCLNSFNFSFLVGILGALVPHPADQPPLSAPGDLSSDVLHSVPRLGSKFSEDVLVVFSIFRHFRAGLFRTEAANLVVFVRRSWSSASAGLFFPRSPSRLWLPRDGFKGRFCGHSWIPSLGFCFRT